MADRIWYRLPLQEGAEVPHFVPVIQLQSDNSKYGLHPKPLTGAAQSSLL